MFLLIEELLKIHKPPINSKFPIKKAQNIGRIIKISFKRLKNRSGVLDTKMIFLNTAEEQL